MIATKGVVTSVEKIIIVSILALAMLLIGLAPSVGATDYNNYGNPGNHKPVGNAGESPNGRDFGSGRRGMSE